jgi:hypothetical protein
MGQPQEDGQPPAAGDWRVTLAGDDQDRLGALNRFKSANDFMDAFDNAQKTIRSGQHKAPVQLGENPTDEELATFRSENGIPDDPKGYLDLVPDGVVFGENDEAVLNSFLETAHGKNYTPDQVNEVLDWYANDLMPQQEQLQTQEDTAFRNQAIETLREKWGNDYKPNFDAAMNHLQATFPKGPNGEDQTALLLGARLADGSLAGDNPAMLEYLANVAHELNPAGFVAPGSGLSQEQSVSSEIATIEQTMRTEPNKYWGDNTMQERYRTLLEARDKLQARA